MHNQKKDNTQFKKKEQPELPENETAWKSDNQGVKDETFIQTGRRGRKLAWRGCETRWQIVWARWGLADQVVPHLCVDKLGGTIGE